MKIVFNTDQIYMHGGIEKVMTTKANYFAGLSDVEVYIVTTEQKKQLACYPLDSRIKLIDLQIDYNRSKSYFSKENIQKSFIHWKKQKELFKSLKPDVIISPNFNFDHYWLPFIKQKSVLLKERHSSRYKEDMIRRNASLLTTLKLKLNDWFDSRYDKIIVLNEDEKTYVKSNNAVVIPNPTENQVVKSKLINKKVMAAGRISPVKSFDHLIRAWAIVHQSFPDWQLDIYGENYLNTQNQLEKLISDLELQSVVHFKGIVDNIPQKMTEYSIYAMTSETECFPMVLLEALSVGLPIVSYDSPNGPRNIITTGQDGLLAKYNDYNDLAAKIQILIQNESLRREMGENAKKNSCRFTTFEVMKKWQSLLNLTNV